MSQTTECPEPDGKLAAATAETKPRLLVDVFARTGAGAVRTFPDAVAGTPDIRGPWRYLLWMAASFWRALLADCVCNALWTGSQALTPGAIGEAVNAGLIARDQTALIWWGLAVLGLGVAIAMSALLVERFETTV